MTEEFSLLARVTNDERAGLARLLECQGTAPQDLMNALQRNSQSMAGRIFGTPPDYLEILHKCLDKLKVRYEKTEPRKALEAKLVHKVIGDAWSQMTPEQREGMQRAMAKAARIESLDESRLAALGPIAALSAAQISGFGIYLFATTALSAITGALGVALPFAAYTAMSSAISVVIGPAAWIGAGLFAIWKLTGPDFKRVIPAVLMISALRDKYTRREPQPEYRGGWLRWVLLGMVIAIVYGCWPSKSKQVPVESSTHALPPAHIAQPVVAPVALQPTPQPKKAAHKKKPKPSSNAAARKRGDIRYCLDLPSPESVAQCAERAK